MGRNISLHLSLFIFYFHRSKIPSFIDSIFLFVFFFFFLVIHISRFDNLEVVFFRVFFSYQFFNFFVLVFEKYFLKVRRSRSNFCETRETKEIVKMYSDQWELVRKKENVVKDIFSCVVQSRSYYIYTCTPIYVLRLLFFHLAAARFLRFKVTV